MFQDCARYMHYVSRESITMPAFAAPIEFQLLMVESEDKSCHEVALIREWCKSHTVLSQSSWSVRNDCGQRSAMHKEMKNLAGELST